MIIRWLGAFRKNNSVSLHSSMEYELSGALDRCTMAAEYIPQGGKSAMRKNVKVGLLVAGKPIKVFKTDVWSEYLPDGRLKQTRSEFVSESSHQEAWVKPRYKAIIVRGIVKQNTLRTVEYFAKKYSLEVIKWTK